MFLLCCRARGERRFLSFFRSLLDFIENIYKTSDKVDALEASKKMMDFLSFAAKNCFLPIVPSFSNAVTAMELQVQSTCSLKLPHSSLHAILFLISVSPNVITPGQCILQLYLQSRRPHGSRPFHGLTGTIPSFHHSIFEAVNGGTVSRMGGGSFLRVAFLGKSP